MSNTPAVYDFNAIGETLAAKRPSETGDLPALLRRLDATTDMLVDGEHPSGREITEAEWDTLNAQALDLERRIIAAPVARPGDIWAKFKLIEAYVART